MARLFVMIFWSLAFSLGASAEITPAEPLSLYKVKNLEAMPEVAKHFEVVRKLADGYEVIVPRRERRTLFRIDKAAQLIDADISASQKQMPLASAKTGVRYRNWTQVQSELADLEKQHSGLTKLIPYGKSQQNQPLLALQLSDQNDENSQKPEIMITAATHGDEVITTEVIMNLVHRLIDGASRGDTRLQKIVKDHRLFFVPVVNPDGYLERDRYDNNVDPNRSYPYPDNPNARPTASINGLISFFHAHQFKGSIDYHAYGELVMYPWAYTENLIGESDRARFDDLAREMALGIQYTFGPISQVIYVARGSSADYYYWKNKTKAFAVEIGSSKQPNPDLISTYTDEQAEPLWKFLESF